MKSGLKVIRIVFPLLVVAALVTLYLLEATLTSTAELASECKVGGKANACRVFRNAGGDFLVKTSDGYIYVVRYPIADGNDGYQGGVFWISGGCGGKFECAYYEYFGRIWSWNELSLFQSPNHGSWSDENGAGMSDWDANASYKMVEGNWQIRFTDLFGEEISFGLTIR